MSWITVTGAPAPELEARLSASVKRHIAEKNFTQDDIDYVRAVDLRAVKGELEVDTQRLERLRNLCRLFEVELRPAQITSHRKLVGPLIVGAKKMLYPILRVLLKDFVRQQRAFNGAATALLADLCNEAEPLRKGESPH